MVREGKGIHDVEVYQAEVSVCVCVWPRTDVAVTYAIYQWRSQKFSTGGALISGFPSYPHNLVVIYLIDYVTKYFSEK